MLKSLIILPDGTELSSGVGKVNALQNVKLTQCVNAGTELTIGSVCADMLEATLLTPGGQLNIAAGTEVAFYKEDESGKRTKLGLFTLETPTRPSANTYRLTAYDRVSWLDRDLTQWLAGLDQWPYTLFSFAQKVCSACNLELKNTEVPNGDLSVPEFSASGITGRKLIQWVAEACGRFCRADADGKIELAWYTPSEITLEPSGERYYYGNTLRYEDYQVAPVDKVQIRQTDSDVGTSYGTGTNVYTITGNMLLTAGSEELTKAAQVIYNTLHSAVYTPCKVAVPANVQIGAGDVLQVVDKNGERISVYVMTKVLSGQREMLECTGSAYRGSSTEVNNATYKALHGKVMELQIGVDGLRTNAKEVDGRLSAAETSISQSAEEIALRATKTEVAAAKSEANGYAAETAADALREAKADTNEKLGAYSTTKEMNAAISLSAEGVKSTVSSTYATKQALQSTDKKADDAQTAVDALTKRVTTAETSITQNSNEIALRATKSEVAEAEADAVAAAGAEAGLKANAALNSANAGINSLKKEVEAKFTVMSDEIALSFQKTEDVQQQVDGIQTQGVTKVRTTTGYTFDEDGFTVTKTGREMKTQITEDGMTVYKNDKTVLTANNEGVDAVNLHASTFLTVGGKSRFEKFGEDRVGCFWIG